jgi:Ser/Thr protein kinase RdoA (MazF antagonist)
MADFDHPFSEHVLLWDLSHADQLAELLDNIESEALRENCQRQLRRFAEQVKPELSALRSQVIYNDLNSSNLLVNPVDTQKITGIIDFGDMVKSLLVIDVAVAAAYLCGVDDNPLAGIVKFLKGYSQVQPLQKEEVALLYDLIMTRNVMTIVITHWRAARHPENREYILRNEPLARATIETLTELGSDYVTEVFLNACVL